MVTGAGPPRLNPKPLRLQESERIDMKTPAGFCDICGHHVAIRQRAHIVAEGRKTGPNLLLLCPSCHVNFDTRLKPAICRALREAGVGNLPASWQTSIYEQAARASQAARAHSGAASKDSPARRHEDG